MKNTEFELISSGGYIDSQKEIGGTVEEPKTITAYYEIRTYTFISYPQEGDNYDHFDPESGGLYHRLKNAADDFLVTQNWKQNFTNVERYDKYCESWNRNKEQVEKDLRKLLNIEGETSFGLWNLLDEIFTVVTTKRINIEE